MNTSASDARNSMSMGISSKTTPSMHQHDQQQRKHNNMVSARCNKKIPTRNSFDALNNLIYIEEVENPDKNMVLGKGTVKDKKILEPILKQISG